MWQQRVLLVVAVYGARGDDVVLVLIHQSQLGVVIYCSKQGGRQAQVKGDNLEHTNPGTSTEPSKQPRSIHVTLWQFQKFYRGENESERKTKFK